jgi:hypothetical protein
MHNSTHQDTIQSSSIYNVQTFGTCACLPSLRSLWSFLLQECTKNCRKYKKNRIKGRRRKMKERKLKKRRRWGKKMKKKRRTKN